MRSLRTKTGIVLGVACALVLSGNACNDIGNDGNNAEVVVVVSSITPAGLSVAGGGDTTVTLGLTLKDRTSGFASSFFNNVTFVSYQVSFVNLSGGTVPASILPSPINSGYSALGSTASLVLILIPAASPKPAAGDVVVASVNVDGQDLQGRPFSFTADVGLQFTP